MSKKITKKPAPIKPYNVIVLECPHCGEEKYYILSCEHCGAEGAMRFKEQRLMSKKELEEFYDQTNGEISGDIRTILRSDDDDDKGDVSTPDADIPPFTEEDMTDDLSLEEL